MYEQSFETEFIADDVGQVFDTDFTTSDEVFNTAFISEDEVFNTSFDVEEQVFNTSFEAEEQVFDTEFEAAVSDGEGGACLPDVTVKDDGKILKVQRGRWSVGEDEATALSNLDIETLLKNFK